MFSNLVKGHLFYILDKNNKLELKIGKVTDINTNPQVYNFAVQETDITVDVNGEKSETGLPKSNVLYFDLEKNAWVCVRPSGTEPKIKFYMGVCETSSERADKELESLEDAVRKMAEDAKK